MNLLDVGVLNLRHDHGDVAALAPWTDNGEPVELLSDRQDHAGRDLDVTRSQLVERAHLAADPLGVRRPVVLGACHVDAGQA